MSAVEPREYAGQTIDTDVVNANSSNIQLRYARETGVLCAFKRTETGNFVVSLEIAQSQIIAELPSFFVLAVILYVVSVFIVYEKRVKVRRVCLALSVDCRTVLARADPKYRLKKRKHIKEIHSNVQFKLAHKIEAL